MSRRLPAALEPWLPALAWPALLLLAALCYWPGLPGPALLDDEPQLLPLIRALDIGSWHARAPALLVSGTGPAGRPVAMLSLAASAIAHGFDLYSFKYENLMLHLLSGCLLLAWLLALRRGLQLSGRPGGGTSPWPALVGTGFWLIHPLLLSTVLYTVQRMTVLSTLFTLAGLVAYCAARNRQLAAGDADRQAPWMFAVGALVCLPLALFSKENGVLLLPMCAAVEVCVYAGHGTPRQRRLLRGLGALLLGLPLLLAGTVLAPALWNRIVSGYLVRDFTLGERLLSEARALMYYLGEWLLPGNANLSFFHDDFPVSRSLLEPWTTLPALAGIAALLGIALWLRRRQPLLALGILLFLIGHLLESSVIALELVFEHRNYLPGIGLAVVVMGLATLPLPRQVPRYLAVCLACAVLLGLSLRTATRAAIWASPWSLFPTLYAANPDSPRLAAYFANNYINGGQFDLARRVLRAQHTPGAALQLLDVDCMARRSPDAEQLQTVLAGLHGVVTAYEASEIVHLVNDALHEHCGLPLPWARTLVDRALMLTVSQPSSWQLLLLYRAHLDHALSENAEAQSDLLRSAAVAPGNPLPLLLATEWALEQHDLPLARERLAAAQAIARAPGGEYAGMFQTLEARVARAAP